MIFGGAREASVQNRERIFFVEQQAAGSEEYHARHSWFYSAELDLSRVLVLGLR